MSVLTNTRLSYLRYTTKQFIQDDPVSVKLMRKLKVAKPGGGHDFVRGELPAQVFRLINQDITSGMIYGQDDGLARKFTYVMVGVHDTDIDIDDVWDEGNIFPFAFATSFKSAHYNINSILPDNGYETRAYITCFAENPEHG